MAMKPDDDRISELYRQSHDEVPPVHIDTAILEAARKATARRSRAGRPFSGCWQVPAALAAVLMVAVLLVPLLERGPQDSGIPAPAPVVQEEALPAAPQPLDRVVPEKVMESEQAVRQERMPRLVAPLVKPKTVTHSKKRAASTGEEKLSAPDRKATVGHLISGLRGGIVEPPQAWLQSISALLKAGEATLAGKELQAFLKQYPDYSLPPELLELQKRTEH